MQEFIDFLGKQFPYNQLDPEDLERLGRTVEVEFFAAGTTIVAANSPQLDHLYVIRTGEVQVRDRGREVDELAPGDTFGHISVLSGLPPALSVVAESETVCYRLADPRTFLREPEKLTFAHYNSMVSRNRLIGTGADRATRPVGAFMRPALWCEANTSVRDAARMMSEQNQSCVLFDSAGRLGIMTDSDCRRRVVTGDVPIDAPVAAIATVPARSVPAAATAAEAYLEMLQHSVHHLVVENDRGRPVGITRVFDLSSAQIRDPLVVRAAIDEAADPEQLVKASRLLGPTMIELHDAGVPALRACTMIAALAEAILEKCIQFEEVVGAGASGPTLSSSWLVLGSLARREPMRQGKRVAVLDREDFDLELIVDVMSGVFA